MAVPDFQSLMLPMLDLLRDGETWRSQDIDRALADALQLSADDREEMLPSGTQKRYTNRSAWAKVHLTEAGLLERVSRGVYRIAPRGLEVLRSAPERVTMKLLNQYPEYQEFRARTHTKTDKGHDDGDAATPLEQIEAGYQSVRRELAEELLGTVQSCSPEFFEKLVIDLLVAMGYGGSQADASRVGRSGDGGIDGIIKEDRLGLDAVYVQAKRW
jgi:restriction system protein